MASKRNRKWWVIGVTAAVAALVAFAVVESRRTVPPPGNIGAPAGNARSGPIGNGRVTMIDLGADECVPCKMMAPILVEVKNEYAGKADIVFIDVWKDPDQATKYGIQAIPTQIFFDKDGREVFRHMGFLDKQRIVEILKRLGVS